MSLDFQLLSALLSVSFPELPTVGKRQGYPVHDQYDDNPGYPREVSKGEKRPADAHGAIRGKGHLHEQRDSEGTGGASGNQGGHVRGPPGLRGRTDTGSEYLYTMCSVTD